MEKLDVLIAGAGPVGLTMASELARYGLAVRIVDKNSQRTDKSKALVLWARTLELIDRMSPNGADRFIQAGIKTESVKIVSGSETIGRADMNEVDSKYKFVLMVAQSETERLLEEHLATFNVNAERQTELTDFTMTADGVSCVLKRADGSEETVETSWLIGADGAHSTVRHKLGMEFRGSTLLSDWVLADLHLSGVPDPPAVNIYWHAEGLVAIFPLGGSRYRVIADVGESNGSIGETNRPVPTLEDTKMQASNPVWLSSFSINERKVAEYRSGRVFLAGDAAHVHSPAGGQGMNTGMQDACNLAWKLALVARGFCQPEPLLSSYSAERSHIAKLLLEATGKATAIAITRGEVKQYIRNHVASLVFGFAPVTHTMANVLSEITIGYSDSLLNWSHGLAIGGPAPGKRAPIRSNEAVTGSGSSPRFVLFDAPDNAVMAVVKEFPEVVDQQLRPPFKSGGQWLVRPDGYIALRARDGAAETLRKYLVNIGAKRSIPA